MNQDISLLRTLAEQYREACADPVNDRRRDLWRRHNSLEETPVLIKILGGRAFRHEIITESDLQCRDPFWREHERILRTQLFRYRIGDDTVFEPWITQRAIPETPLEQLFGHERRITERTDDGAWLPEHWLTDLTDVASLTKPHHGIDEPVTRERADRLREAIGDIVAIDVDRSPVMRGFGGDISTQVGEMRGFEQIMLDMLDDPPGYKALLAFLRDSVMTVQAEAEQAGDWSLTSQSNQAETYARELPDPEPNRTSVSRDQLWGYFAAQEYAAVSPEMHDEFLLQYQLPIMKQFGLAAYGCCEDLTHKIGILRQVPNLRRIAVTPWADVRKCAEQIGRDFVLSWRPQPSAMITEGFDAGRVARIVREGLDASRGCIVDITLKDITSVAHQPENLKRWVDAVRRICDR